MPPGGGCPCIAEAVWRTRSRRRTFFFFNDTATTEIYTLSLHDALPIYPSAVARPIALQKMSGEEGNVFASLPQRGDIDLDDSETEEQILAESLCPQFLRNVTIR